MAESLEDDEAVEVPVTVRAAVAVLVMLGVLDDRWDNDGTSDGLSEPVDVAVRDAEGTLVWLGVSESLSSFSPAVDVRAWLRVPDVLVVTEPVEDGAQ